MLFNRTFQTLALTFGLLATAATASLADGVAVVPEGGDDADVVILQHTGYNPDAAQGDAATQIAARLGTTPNYWEGTDAFNQANQFEEWVHVVVVPVGHSSLRAAQVSTAQPVSQSATTAQPTAVTPVAAAASGIPGHGVAGTDTLVVSVDGGTEYFTVPSGTNHGNYVSQQYPGRSVSWDSHEGAGTDRYTAYLTVH